MQRAQDPRHRAQTAVGVSNPAKPIERRGDRAVAKEHNFINLPGQGSHDVLDHREIAKLDELFRPSHATALPADQHTTEELDCHGSATSV